MLWAISSVLGYRAVHDWVWDVDECALDRGLCGPHGQCVNKWWSFTCKCNAGYAFDGTTCVDVDECASGSHECGPHGACVNEEGSYRCECAEGFRQGTFGGRARCVDVDECAETPGLCGAGRCENRPGGYDCQCRSQARLGWISTEVGDHSGTSSVRLPTLLSPDRVAAVHLPYPIATFPRRGLLFAPDVLLLHVLPENRAGPSADARADAPPPEEGGLGALPLDAHTAARRLRHLARALITKRVGAHGQLDGLAGILTACLEGLGAGRLGLLPFSLPETDGCYVAQLIESRRLRGKLPALESFCDAIKGLGTLRATLGPVHARPPLAPTTDEVARQRWTGLAAEGLLTLIFDGGSRGNGSDTSTAGAGAVLAAGAGEGVETLELAGPAVRGASNNQAEFAALLGGLRAAVELGATKLRVRGDSLLVIRAMDPRDCSVLRHPAMVPLWTEAQRLAAGLDITWEHVPREQNALADRLSNVAMDGHGWRGARVGGGGLAGTDGSRFASSTDFFTPVTGTTKGDLLCASLLTPGVLCAAGGGAPGAGVAGLGAPAMEGAAGPLHNDMGQDQDDSASSLHSFATGVHGRAGGAWVHDGASGDDNTDDGIDEGGAGRPAGGGRPLLLHPVGRAMALRGFGTVGHYLCIRDPARRWDTWVSWAFALGYDRLPGVDRRGLGWVVGAFMRDLGLLGPGNEYARPDVEGQWDPWDGLALTEGFMERLRLASPGGGEANDFYRPMTATAPGWALDPGVASRAALDLAS